ncbi:reverse transcriptase domain-containing protein [Tanacetum coccineum]
MEKIFQIFQDLRFDISFADALLLMPRFAPTIKSLLMNKEKLLELAKIPLNENCSAMLLKKLPEKLGDPGKFLIPCNFPGMDVCHALADLGASINLMPLSIWKKLSLPELTPTRMTLELADRSITYPKGLAEDVFVKVGKFHFPTDFVVVDFEADPRVPLILGRSFLRTGRALIDVYGEEITLRVDNEAVTFNLDQTTRYSSTNDKSVNRIDIIDAVCEEYAPELLGFPNSSGGNPTPTSEPFTSEFILEEIEAYLKDDSISPEIDHADCNPEEDICLIEKLLNNDPFQLPPMDLKQSEVTEAKSSIEEPPELELKDLPSHLEYAFLEENDKLPVIIAKGLKNDEKDALLKVLKSHKGAIAWKITDIKGIDSHFCTHKILMEDDYKLTVQSKRRGKDDGITALVKSILDGFGLMSFGQGGGDFLEERTKGNTKQCLRKVADGNFTAAVKVLSSFGVAPYCDDTIKALKAKHPYKPPAFMLSKTFSKPPLVAEIDSVVGCSKSFPKGTSCGRDGLRAQHILDALCGEGSTTATDILKVITLVINLWLTGRCSPILAEFVAYAPLTHLLKPDNGIQPIAVGTIWRRLVSKVSMKGVGKEMLKYLSDFQFGVGVGTEAVLHSVNRLLSEYHNDGSLAMLIVDFSNAFNLMDRSSLLQEYIRSKTVASFFFMHGILMMELLLKIQKRLPRSSLGVKLLRGAVSRDADFINGMAMRSAVNTVDLMSLLPQLHDPQSELLLLRSCMGISKLFFSLRTCQPVHMEEAALIFDKGLCGSIENIVVCGGPFFGDLQWRLASLPIRLGGLGLYAVKVAYSYAFVASRAQSWVLHDHILRESGICGMVDDYVCALACLRGTIPRFDFSCFTNKDTAPSKPQQIMASALFIEMVKDMEAHFDMTVRLKVVFECLRVPHA